jgi:hypothetical protein
MYLGTLVSMKPKMKKLFTLVLQSLKLIFLDLFLLDSMFLKTWNGYYSGVPIIWNIKIS